MRHIFCSFWEFEMLWIAKIMLAFVAEIGLLALLDFLITPKEWVVRNDGGKDSLSLYNS